MRTISIFNTAKYTVGKLKHNSTNGCRGHVTICEMFVGNYTNPPSASNDIEDALFWLSQHYII